MRMFLPLVFIPALIAQESSPRPKLLRDFAAAAMAAPPELAASALLSLVEYRKIDDPVWRRELIETAWSLAPGAVFRNPIANAVQTNIASDADMLFDALRPGLTTAGLQSRAVVLMDSLDAKHARDMFLEMPRPAPQTLSCEVDRYESHVPWFTAMIDVAQHFTPDERAQGKRTVFLTEQIRSLATPEDFEQALAFFASQSDLGNDEFGELMNLWAAGLLRANLTDRVYSSRPQIWLLAVPQMTKRGLSPVPVIAAIRTYFVRHESAERCGDAPITRAEAMRKAFNDMAVRYAPNVPEIKPEEIQPAGRGAKAKIDNYFDSDGMRSIAAEYEHLRFGGKAQQAAKNLSPRPDGLTPYLNSGQRAAPEWNQEALHFLDHLEAWSKEHDQSTKDLFHQKCSWYSGFFDIVPEGELRDRVLHSYLSFLSGSTIERESPAEWLLWVNRLIGSREAADREHWLNRIEAGGDATIALYVRLSRLTTESSAKPPAQ